MLKRFCISVGAIGALGLFCVIDSPLPFASWVLALGFFFALTLLGAVGAWYSEGRRG